MFASFPKVLSRDHWQNVYTTKNETQVSWFALHLESSMVRIKEYAALSDPVIDIGGGASTLPDDLLAAGFADVTVLDISEAALAAARKRLGKQAEKIQWIVADVTTVTLPEERYALWHDRAVFHFLVRPEDRRVYVEHMRKTLRSGGVAIIATFGPDGPTVCSDLPTERYDARKLEETLGQGFELFSSEIVSHATPFNTTQQFHYGCVRRL